MRDKVWVNIGKWLKPIGSTFTVEVENDTPKADPAALFDGNWIPYQTQTISTETGNIIFTTFKRIA